MATATRIAFSIASFRDTSSKVAISLRTAKALARGPFMEGGNSSKTRTFWCLMIHQVITGFAPIYLILLTRKFRGSSEARSEGAEWRGFRIVFFLDFLRCFGTFFLTKQEAWSIMQITNQKSKHVSPFNFHNLQVKVKNSICREYSPNC